MSEIRTRPPTETAAIQTADTVARVVVWLICAILVIFRFLVTVVTVLGGRLLTVVMNPRVRSNFVGASLQTREFLVELIEWLHYIWKPSASAPSPPPRINIRRSVSVEVNPDPEYPTWVNLCSSTPAASTSRHAVEDHPVALTTELTAPPTELLPPPPTPVAAPALTLDHQDIPPPTEVRVPIANSADGDPIAYGLAEFDPELGEAGNWFAVTVGRSVSVFHLWTNVGPYVSGVSNACFSCGPTRAQAFAKFRTALRRGQVRIIP